MPALRLAALLSLALLAPSGPAGAAGALAPASGADQVAPSCEARGAQRGSEVEPTVAVDPRDPAVAVAAWQQDRYAAGGGAAALGVSFSRDGGASWAPSVVPGLTTCGGRHARRSDPWLSFGADRSVYLAGVVGTLSSGRGLRTGVALSVSHDGGSSWAPPTVVAPAIGPFNDKPSVTADPTRPGYAYAVWSQLHRILLARTTDGGATWEDARTIARGQLVNVSTISVLPDGTLLHAFQRAGRTRERVLVSRSTDAGATWSPARAVGTVDEVALRDVRGGVAVRAEALAAPAAVGAPDGSAYAAWTTRGAGGHPRVVVARSGDGGMTWTRPRTAIAASAAPFAPALAVGADGTVALTAYRLRPRGRADAIAALSSDRARHWRTRALTPVFSLGGAPRTESGARFLGDYSGLVPVPGGFLAALAVAPPLATNGPSDVVATRF